MKFPAVVVVFTAVVGVHATAGGTAAVAGFDAASVVSSSAALVVTPIQKVIALLDGMLQKGKTDKHEEQVQFAAYKQFCDDTTAEKRKAVTQADELIELLKADIQKHTTDAETLAQEMTELDNDIAVWSGDEKAAAKVRSIEKADYDAIHKDYSESIDALQRAIAVLKKQAYDRPGAALAQVAALKKLQLMPASARRAIDAFLSEPDDGLAISSPEANAYEFQSHGIIEMLEKLLDKFIDERTIKEKEEMNARHAYELLVQDLKAQIAQAGNDRMEKASTKAKKLQAKADAQGDLEDIITTQDSDKKFLQGLTATCQQKAADFETRQQLRSEELEAIQEAVNILSGDTVSGAAAKHLPILTQLRATSMAQLRATIESPAQQRVVQYLQVRAKQLDSRVLSAVAAHIADDPFSKVKKMIKDLIVRLMDEANEEAEHKGWCDTELSTNEQTRKEKTAAVQTLHAEVDELQASIAELTENIAKASKQKADLIEAMSNATSLRAAEKATNSATVKDAQDAQTAVAQALVVLQEFYAKAADATALLQRNRQAEQPVAPGIFDSPYKGMQSEKGGVIGLLQVVQSDFARLEAETSAEEAASQNMHDDFMTRAKVLEATEEKDLEHWGAKKQDQQQALTLKTADLEGTQKELDAALAYYDKLKPSCVDAGTSYDDRIARRKEEIQSLQEALRILNGEDIA